MILFIDRMEYESPHKPCNHKITAIGKLNTASFGFVVKSLRDNIPDKSYVSVIYSGVYSGNKPKLVKRLYKVQRELSGKVFAVFYYPDGTRLRDKAKLNSYYGIENEKYTSKIPVFDSSVIKNYL
jgi:hypothetical protein